MEMLKAKKHFNNVDWNEVKSHIEMKDIRKNLRQYTNLHLVNEEGDNVTTNPIEMPPTAPIPQCNGVHIQANTKHTTSDGSHDNDSSDSDSHSHRDHYT